MGAREQKSAWAADNWFIALGSDVRMCVCSCVCLAGAVSLAGAQNNLWAVEGGNKLVCSGLLKMANANLLQAQVSSVSLVYSGT